MSGGNFVGVKVAGTPERTSYSRNVSAFAPTPAINVTYPDQTVWSVFHAAKAAWRVFSGGLK
jgi:hypothetical protein